MKIGQIIPFTGFTLMMLTAQAIALWIATPMRNAGIVAFEDPGSMANPLIFIGMLLVFTFIMIMIIKLGGRRILSLIIAGSIFFSLMYIFISAVSIISGMTDITVVTAVLLAGATTAALYIYPEWYVIDTIGVLVAGGLAAIFGISLEVLPVILLLIILSVYDAISVYRTKHMITLADGVVESKAPIFVMLPKKRDFSFVRGDLRISDKKEERGAFVLGMGDLIMPSILVVSAYIWVDSPGVIFNMSYPVLGAIAGAVFGMALLMYIAGKGNAHAGLPPLNGCTILGFIAGSLVAGAGICI